MVAAEGRTARWRTMVTLATARPAKFPKAVSAAYDAEPHTPQRVLDMLQEEERLTPVADDLAAVKNTIRKGAPCLGGWWHILPFWPCWLLVQPQPRSAAPE